MRRPCSAARIWTSLQALSEPHSMRYVASWAVWAVLSTCLAGSPAAAEYDWYSQEEGSSSSSEDDDGTPASASPGWGLGLRLGYAVPFGDAAAEGPMDSVIKGAVKPQLDIRYGLDAHLALAAYLAVGGGLKPAELKRACDLDGVDCRLLTLESGLLAEYRILPSALVDPWAGINVGLEWLSQNVEARGAEASLALLGVGFGASAGADFELENWAIGPFLGVQVGRFMRSKVALSGAIFDEDELTGDGKIDSRAYHYWLNVGLRVRYP